MFDVVEAPTVRNVTVELMATCSPTCRLGDAPFAASIVVTYMPRKNLIEIISFERWVESLSEQKTTIEELCAFIFEAVSAAVQLVELKVQVIATTEVHRPVRAWRSGTFL